MPKPIKYFRFREEVNRLISKYYGAEVSESKMEIIESKFTEYSAKDNYDIFVSVASGDWMQDFKVSKEDLLRFVRKPRAVVKIEKLSLYTEANDALSKLYYEVVEPDENGIIHDCPKVSKTFRITTDMFRIKEEGLTCIEEKIKNDYQIQPQKPQSNEIIRFPTPDGAKWTDVEITFIDNEYVKIKIKDEIKKRIHYSEIGFKDKRSGKPTKLWRETLRFFAFTEGIITFTHINNKLTQQVSVDDVKRLNKQLCSCFGILNNPIKHYRDKGKSEGYKTTFIIKDESCRE